MNPTRLVLIRHGESRAQAGGFASGHDACTGLSDLGRRQAAALRDRLARTRELAPVDVVYTSLLTRAQETAAIIGSALECALATPECEWCEIHAGAAEGLTYDEIRARYPVAGDSGDVLDRDIPGVETWTECCDRVGRRLRRAASDHRGQRIVVVGHGGTIAAGFFELGGLPQRDAVALIQETQNTSITEWRQTADGWRLVRFNDAAHLFDL